jgi:hypothetical protein
LEMSKGFASYTAATADVDRDGKGQAAAATEFVKLFLDPKGSTLQDIFVDETAQLGDALTRAALRTILVDNPAAKATAAAFRAPKQIASQNPTIVNTLPSPLGKQLVEYLAALPDRIDKLVSLDVDDERVISTARELSNAMGSRVFTNENPDRHMRTGQLSNGVGAIPPILPTLDPQLSMLLTNKETRTKITNQLPGIVNLGRRVGAGLLTRAAYRTERSILPSSTKNAFAGAATSLASFIEPPTVQDE